MKWIDATLGKLIDVKHGFAFKSEFFSDAGDYILLTPGNCYEKGGLKLKGEKELFYTGEFPREYLLSFGDLLIVMTDLVGTAPVLGGAFRIPEDNLFLHNQRLGLVKILDGQVTDKVFIYYLLNNQNYRGQIRGSASGATVRHTSPGRIKKCKVKIPTEKSTQQRIGKILSSYDDLIDTNRRRIQLLEESARLLFREWFVYFRFPHRRSLSRAWSRGSGQAGHEKACPVESINSTGVKIVDGVPEGWASQPIATISDCVGGGTPSTSMPAYWVDGDITWVTPTDVTRNKHFVLLDSEKKITEAGLQNSSAKLVPAHTILMTSRASVGFFAIANREVCTNQGFISIVPHDAVFSLFLLFQLSERVEEIRAMGSGSTYPEVSRGKFRDFKVIIPPKKLVSDFDEQASFCFKQISNLKQQNQKLAQARDLLLPRLMSGAIDPVRYDKLSNGVEA